MKNKSISRRSFIRVLLLVTLIVLSIFISACKQANSDKLEDTITFPIVDTNQGLTYDNFNQITPPASGEAFYGQDAQYTGNKPSYTDNGDGTITDNITGLTWTQELSTYSMPWSEASEYCESLTTGDKNDWRLPTVKELWSLRDYSQGWPWVDTDYFHLVGDGTDLAQHHSWSSNRYLVKSEFQNQQLEGDPSFIVNDWTGHIKAMSGSRFVRAVRGRNTYGINNFVDNSDGTVTDKATGLMWSQEDNGKAINWQEALAYAEGASIAGYDNWRLPNIKELQSIADYSGSFPALDTSVFKVSELKNIKGQLDYPFYWSSTSNPYIEAFHQEADETGLESDFIPGFTYAWALAVGYCVDMEGNDLHGAGAVVFDTKSEDVTDGSGIEIFYHHVRLVRVGNVTETPEGDATRVKENRLVIFPEGEVRRGADGPGGQQGGRPDFTATAEKLGITEAQLMNAMGDPKQGPPDLTNVAKELGITETELKEALNISNPGNQDDEKAPKEKK